MAAALALANWLYGFFILPESLKPENRAPFEWKKANPIGALSLLRSHPQVLGLAAVVFLSAVAHEVLPSLWVLYTDYRYQWDEQMVGLTLGLVGLTTMAVQGGLVGYAVKHFGEKKNILFGIFFGVIAFAIHAAAPTGLLFMVGVPLLALWGLAGPATQGLMSQSMADDEQGRLQGAIAAIQGVAHMIGPGMFTGIFAVAVANKTSAYASPGAPFYLAAFFLVAAGITAIIVIRRHQSPSQPPTSGA